MRLITLKLLLEPPIFAPCILQVKYLHAELVKSTVFCIYAAILPVVTPNQTLNCRFFVSFMLATCIATVEREIARTEELKLHTKILLDFEFSTEQDDPVLEIVLPVSPSSEYTTGLQGRTKVSYLCDKMFIFFPITQILLRDIDFFSHGKYMLKLQEEKGIYPPRFNVFISCSPTARQSKARIQFKGSAKEFIFDIPVNPQQSTVLTATPPCKQ